MKIHIFVIFLIVVSFGIGAYFYDSMPDKMASHWNASGGVDGHLPKFWGLFLMPIVSVGIYLLFLAIPLIDPLKKNIDKFRKYFDMFILLIMGFLFYIYILTISWSLGYRFDMGRMMLPALAVIFYYAGVLIGKAKRNWFIGIRTPWTLSSDKVWDRTHRLSAKMFKVAGAITFVGVFFPEYALLFILVPVLIAGLYPIAYSYYIYTRK